jgi:adenine deaminase
MRRADTVGGGALARHRLAEVALGRRPADLVLRGARVVNVFTGAVEPADVAVAGGRVAALGSYRGPREVELGGRFLAPGLCDAHVHVESSHLTPSEFARAVVPRGTVSVLADPHELANVGGADAVRWFVADTAATPLRVRTMVPSCVPACPFGTPGQVLDAADVAALVQLAEVAGLAEVMDVPAVLAGDPEVLAKLAAADGRLVDGHAPGLGAAELCAYLDHDIRSDHEVAAGAELREKVARGMYVGLRQGSSAKNLRDLLPFVDPYVARRCFLVTDDRSAVDLAEVGHIDDCLRICVADEMPAAAAVALATLNPAGYLGVRDHGAVAPGYVADLVVFDDLEDFRASLVLVDGEIVARDGEPLWEPAAVPPPPRLRDSVHLDPVRADAFRVPLTGETVRVIDATPGQLVTGDSLRRVSGNELAADPGADIAKVAVLERHHGSGRRGVALVRGLGLRRGAIASTVAHDAHHLVVCGVDDEDMAVAGERVRTLRGGFAVAAGGRVLADLPLPVGGLLSDRRFPDVVSAQRRIRRALAPLTGGDHDPFDTVQFLALPVIPTLKLSDRGLVDVTAGRYVSLCLDDVDEGARPTADVRGRCRRPPRHGGADDHRC